MKDFHLQIVDVVLRIILPDLIWFINLKELFKMIKEIDVEYLEEVQAIVQKHGNTGFVEEMTYFETQLLITIAQIAIELNGIKSVLNTVHNHTSY